MLKIFTFIFFCTKLTPPGWERKFLVGEQVLINLGKTFG